MDIHEEEPRIKASISRVGIVGVSTPIVTIMLGKGEVLLPFKLNAYIDLPRRLRGIHASRNYEVVLDVINEFMQPKLPIKVEDFCARVARKLLDKHEYAFRSEVQVRGEAIMMKETPCTKLATFEPYKMLGRAIAFRHNKGITVKKYVGVEVVGLLACPCAKELVRERIKIEKGEIKEVYPYLGTHMQRCIGRIIIEVPNGFEVDVTKLLEIIELSFSSLSYELLKRDDEVEVVMKSLSQARFVEDAVRLAAEGIVKAFPDFPDDTYLSISQRSLESIHKHDMVAIKKGTLGELRRDLNEV